MKEKTEKSLLDSYVLHNPGELTQDLAARQTIRSSGVSFESIIEKKYIGFKNSIFRAPQFINSLHSQ